MKRGVPSALILLTILLCAAAYWVDLLVYTSQATGFVEQGSVWVRYGIVLVPVGLAFAGLLSLGPRSIAVFRVRNPFLGVAFSVVGLAGLVFGGLTLWLSSSSFSLLNVIMGVLFLWFGVWMLLTAYQMFTQKKPSPTQGAFWGMLAASPFCVLTVQRVLVKPASLYRIAPMVRIFSALFIMLWVGMLLRALYIAMIRSRVRWMYLFGMFSFLFGLLEAVQCVYDARYATIAPLDLAQGILMALMGTGAVCVSLSIALQGDVKAPKVVDKELLERLPATAEDYGKKIMVPEGDATEGLVHPRVASEAVYAQTIASPLAQWDENVTRHADEEEALPWQDDAKAFDAWDDEAAPVSVMDRLAQSVWAPEVAAEPDEPLPPAPEGPWQPPAWALGVEPAPKEGEIQAVVADANPPLLQTEMPNAALFAAEEAPRPQPVETPDEAQAVYTEVESTRPKAAGQPALDTAEPAGEMYIPKPGEVVPNPLSAKQRARTHPKWQPVSASDEAQQDK